MPTPDPIPGLDGSRVLAPDLFAVIDLETSGFSRNAHDIIEIAVVHPEGPGLVLDTLVKPRRRIGNRAVHGITNRDVRHAPVLADIAGFLLDVLAERIVVAHNARFDVGFLVDALAREGVDTALPWLCTLQVHAFLFGERRDLEGACADVAVPLRRERHRASEDAVATAALLRAQLALLEHRSVRTVADLVAHHLYDGAVTPVQVAHDRTLANRSPLHPRPSKPPPAEPACRPR